MWAVPCDGNSECGFNEDEKISLCTIPEETTFFVLTGGQIIIFIGLLVNLIYILQYRIDINDPNLLLFGIDTEYKHETKPLNHLNLTLIQKRDDLIQKKDDARTSSSICCCFSRGTLQGNECSRTECSNIYNEEMGLPFNDRPKVVHYFKVQTREFIVT